MPRSASRRSGARAGGTVVVGGRIPAGLTRRSIWRISVSLLRRSHVASRICLRRHGRRRKRTVRLLGHDRDGRGAVLVVRRWGRGVGGGGIRLVHRASVRRAVDFSVLVEADFECLIRPVVAAAGGHAQGSTGGLVSCVQASRAEVVFKGSRNEQAGPKAEPDKD